MGDLVDWAPDTEFEIIRTNDPNNDKTKAMAKEALNEFGRRIKCQG